MNNASDHYAILGLTSGVSDSDVKAQFRRLAMDVHPDRNEDDPQCQERLKHINAAYEFLSDPVRKAHYDSHSAPPLTSVTAVHAHPVKPAIGGKMLLLVLAVLCVFLIGSVFLLVSDSLPGLTEETILPPANITTLGLTPSEDAPDSDAVAPVAAGETGVADGPAALPTSPVRFWPVIPQAPPPTGPDFNGTSPAPADLGQNWPPADTGPFPSH